MSLKKMQEKGQAIVEFAIVAIVLLLIFFVIIELGRVLWGWLTVQSAARSGSRYAITGQFEPNCQDAGLPCDDPRVVSIRNEILDRLTGLSLNTDEDVSYEDDNALFIEVYGVDEFGVLREDFAGIPGQPVVVRVVYNVPIITPILNTIVESVPVMGQVVANNELFGQTGATNQGQSIAPNIPPIPTAGPTPTFTPSPTPSNTPNPTAGPSPTASNTPTLTSSPTPVRCSVNIEETLVEQDGDIDVSADIGDFITVTDLTTGLVLAQNIEVVNAVSNYACEGFVQITLNQQLQGDHVILVESSNTTFDVSTVQSLTPTPTLIPTNTPQPTNTPTATATGVPPTETPAQPFIFLDRDCAFGPTAQFTLRGFNWTPNGSVFLSWDGGNLSTPVVDDAGSFVIQLSVTGVTSGTYTFTAQNTTATATVTFDAPCTNITPTPTVIPPTETPIPSDLVIGDPILVSTPPIIGYQPVTFRMVITNTGEVDVKNQFFVDLFFDVEEGDLTRDDEGDILQINLDGSSGYRAISSLPGGETRVITITAPIGFEGISTDDRTVHNMVDSVLQVSESKEDNNVAGPVGVQVTPGNTPTPTPTIDGAGQIGGVVRTLYTSWVPQGRARVYLIYHDDVNNLEQVVGLPAQTALRDGSYNFFGVPPITAPNYYEIVACFDVDAETRVGRKLLSPGVSNNLITNAYMLPDASGCPYN